MHPSVAVGLSPQGLARAEAAPDKARLRDGQPAAPAPGGGVDGVLTHLLACRWVGSDALYLGWRVVLEALL